MFCESLKIFSVESKIDEVQFLQFLLKKKAFSGLFMFIEVIVVVLLLVF